MNIVERYTGRSGVTYVLEYEDADSFRSLPYEKCRQVYGVCFEGDELLIGFGGNKKAWGLVGGTIEPGETFEETLKREIQEETNREVLSWRPLGYQKMTDTRDGSFVYQLRYVCKVRPFGPFIEDPAGGVTEIKLIEPTRYKNYFNWGKIGKRMMERSMELKEGL